jgi:lipopolysaccharide transport system permease protein
MVETESIVIEPPRRWTAVDLRDLFAFRELLYFLIWRDIKVRYKQTAIGVAWVILQPLLTMGAFSVIFGGLLGVPSEGVPYPVFSYAALLPWILCATAIGKCTMSLVYDANLISKVYFPRLILPTAAVLGTMVDFAVSFTILLAMMAFYGIVPGVAFFSLPLFLMLAFVTVLSIGLWLAALNVKYRDVSFVVPFFTQFWLFLTPVAYSSTIIPPQWRVVYGLNPMVGVVEGFRWALLGTDNPPTPLLAVSVTVVAILLIGGVFYFRRMEAEFADLI